MFPIPSLYRSGGGGKGETASQFSLGKGSGHRSDHPRNSTQTGLPGSRSLGEVPAGRGKTGMGLAVSPEGWELDLHQEI